MARIRSIKPEFAKDETMAALPRDVRLHYALLWTYADDAGRGIDNPKLIKAELWPLDDEATADVVQGWQDELERAGRIVRYEVGGRRYFVIVHFGDHQKPQKPSASKLPEPTLSAPSETVRVEVQESYANGTGELPPVVVDGVVDVDGVVVAPDGANKPRRGSQIPDEFEIDDGMRAWAAEHCPLVDVCWETAQWRDWHVAKGDTAKNWRASWQTWFRKAQTYAAERRTPARAPAAKPNGHQRTMANLARLVQP